MKTKDRVREDVERETNTDSRRLLEIHVSLSSAIAKENQIRLVAVGGVDRRKRSEGTVKIVGDD